MPSGVLARGALVVLVATVVGLLLSGVQGTSAAFTDTASVRSGGFDAATVQPVTGARCTDPFGKSAVIEWRNVDTRYDYLVEIHDASGKVVGSATVRNAGPVGTTQSLEIRPGEYGVRGGAVVVRRTYVAHVVPRLGAWTGSAVPVPFFLDDIFFDPYVQCP